MEWAVLIIVLIGLALTFIVLQGSLAARHWRRVIADGDGDALRQALDAAFEGWRELKPPPGMVPADWQGLQSAALIVADRDRCRVSLLADTDVRVIDNERHEVGSALDVARRVAVAMAERLLYEVPHVRFEEVQIDVHTLYRDPDGSSRQECLLTTRVSRATASASEWDTEEPPAIVASWETREAAPGRPLDPEHGALIAAAPPGVHATPGDGSR